MVSMKSLWQSITKPILALAPMEDVTDTVFRRIVARCARPDVFFTEFTSVEGLNSQGRDEVIHRFDYTEEERPIIAQVWGNTAALFFKAAKLIADLGFDGIDINMGCPEKSVIDHGAGACLIDQSALAKEIIAATKEGSKSASWRIPVSVKTRLGYKKISPDWIPFLLEQNLDALIIHGRTAAELSKVPARWVEIGKAVTLRNQMKKQTIILGNGDVANYADAAQKCRVYGTDGVMIGRGIFHDLWAFDRAGKSNMGNQQELFGVMREHLKLFDETWGTGRNFAIMKKFFKIYIHGFPNASALRERLMAANNREEAEKILDTSQ